jgi:hypothetical protein
MTSRSLPPNPKTRPTMTLFFAPVRFTKPAFDEQNPTTLSKYQKQISAKVSNNLEKVFRQEISDEISCYFPVVG